MLTRVELEQINLIQLGFKPEYARGDGSCFYNAIAMQLIKDGVPIGGVTYPRHEFKNPNVYSEPAAYLRQRVYQYIKLNKEKFLPAAAVVEETKGTEADWEKYVMGLLGKTWAEAPVIEALKHLLGRSIVVINTSDTITRENVHQACYCHMVPAEEDRPIYVSFTGAHYNLATIMGVPDISIEPLLASAKAQEIKDSQIKSAFNEIKAGQIAKDFAKGELYALALPELKEFLSNVPAVTRFLALMNIDLIRTRLTLTQKMNLAKCTIPISSLEKIAKYSSFIISGLGNGRFTLTDEQIRRIEADSFFPQKTTSPEEKKEAQEAPIVLPTDAKETKKETSQDEVFLNEELELNILRATPTIKGYFGDMAKEILEQAKRSSVNQVLEQLIETNQFHRHTLENLKQMINSPSYLEKSLTKEEREHLSKRIDGHVIILQRCEVKDSEIINNLVKDILNHKSTLEDLLKSDGHSLLNLRLIKNAWARFSPEKVSSQINVALAKREARILPQLKSSPPKPFFPSIEKQLNDFKQKIQGEMSQEKNEERFPKALSEILKAGVNSKQALLTLFSSLAGKNEQYTGPAIQAAIRNNIDNKTIEDAFLSGLSRSESSRPYAQELIMIERAKVESILTYGSS